MGIKEAWKRHAKDEKNTEGAKDLQEGPGAAPNVEHGHLALPLVSLEVSCR